MFRNPILLLLAVCLLLACENKEKATEENTEKEINISKRTITDLKHQGRMAATIVGYCSMLNQGKYKQIARFFAPEVTQWITLRNLIPQTIAKEAERFLKTKKNVKYSANTDEIQVEGNTAKVQIKMQCHDLLEVSVV